MDRIDDKVAARTQASAAQHHGREARHVHLEPLIGLNINPQKVKELLQIALHVAHVRHRHLRVGSHRILVQRYQVAVAVGIARNAKEVILLAGLTQENVYT